MAQRPLTGDSRGQRRPVADRPRTPASCTLILLAGLALAAAAGGQGLPSDLAGLARDGLAARERGDLEAAERAFAGLAAKAPQLVPAHLNLGLVRYERADYARAAESLASALALDGNVPDANALLGHALLEAGNLDAAAARLRKALQRKPGDPRTQFWLARALIEQGREKEADPLLASLSEASGEDPELLRLRILRAGMASGALRAHLLRLAPSTAAAKVTAAEGHIVTGDRLQAIEAYREALRLQPDRRGVRLALGDLHFAQEDYDPAEALYRQEAELRPFAAKPLIRLGDVLLMQGESEEADAALGRALRLDPASALGHELLARAKADQGDYGTALEHLLAATAGAAGPAAQTRIHYQMARLYRRVGDSEAAELHTAKFRDLQRNQAEATPGP